MQLPPLVDPHDTVLMDFHYHSRSVRSSCEVADGVLVPWATGGVFDAVADIGEIGAEGFLVFFGEAVGICSCELGESNEEGVSAAVGGVDVGVLGDVGVFVRVRHEICLSVIGESVFVCEGLVGFLVEKGDVFAGGDLDRRVRAVELFSGSFDGFFAVFGEVVDEGGQETPFFEGGGNGVGLVGGVNEVAV